MVMNNCKVKKSLTVSEDRKKYFSKILRGINNSQLYCIILIIICVQPLAIVHYQDKELFFCVLLFTFNYIDRKSSLQLEISEVILIMAMINLLINFKLLIRYLSCISIIF